MTSNAEDSLATILRWAGIADRCESLRFAPPRRWRFDFAWPERFLAVEVEGGWFITAATAGVQLRGRRREVQRSGADRLARAASHAADGR